MNMISIKVSGKNIDRFINKIIDNKINIINLKYINKNSIIIKINYLDYEKINSIKSIYNYKLVNIYGIIKIKKIIRVNKYLLLFLSLFSIIILILSNVVFFVEINTDNVYIKNLIISELKSNNVYKYSFKKDYNELSNITKNIIKNNNNLIEWLDIKVEGNKYIINFLERKINEEVKKNENRHIVASKSGIITSINGSSGVILKKVNDYVNKGDIIISGEIKNNEELKAITSADGEVYAEVWYNVTVTYPLFENNEIIKKENSSMYNINFLSSSLFKSKYDNYIRNKKNIISNNLLPIGIYKNIDTLVIKNDSVYLVEEAVDKAYCYAKNKVLKMLKKDEEIISQKKLNYFVKGSTIVLDVFFRVNENIVAYEKIEEVE